MLAQIKRFILEQLLPVLPGFSLDPLSMSFYALFFVFTALYIVPDLLSRIELEMDAGLVLGLTPFVFLAGLLSSLNFPLGEPAIYFPFTAAVFLLLYGFNRLEAARGIDYYKPLMLTGLLLLGVSLTRVEMLLNRALVLSIAFWSIPGWFLLKRFRPRFLDSAFTVPVAAHMFDASTTFAVLSMGGIEKNFFTAFFLDLLGPASVFALKSLIVVPVTYYVFTSTEGEERNYYLFLVALLGIAAGVRNIVYLP